MTPGRFIFALSGASVLLAAVGVWAGLRFLRGEFPNVATLKKSYPHLRYVGPGQPPAVTLKSGRPAGWANLEEISRSAIGAILVSEDWAFYEHKGYDLNQIRSAVQEDLEKGRFARGASTITQQVVKNVFLERDKTLWRKLRELLLAVDLERSLSKRRILEVYLNIAEWGDGVYGITAASQRYFHKAPGKLTAKEGAFLAMLLPSPRKYGQSYRSGRLTDFARDRLDDILGKMVQARYLTDGEREAEAAKPLIFELPALGAL